MASSRTAAEIAQDRQKRYIKANKYWDTCGQFLPTAQREAWVSKYTDLGKQYSHPIGNWQYPDNRILRNTGKSGLTPLPRPDNEQLFTNNVGYQKTQRTQLEMYQRKRLKGFSALELYDLEAMSALDNTVMQDNLTGEAVHPIFEKKNWLSEAELPKHRALVPILGDYAGFWSAENPLIWKTVLRPSLSLVRNALGSLSAYHWLDAVFKGPIVPATKSQGTGAGNFRITQRIYEEKNTTAEFNDMQARILALAGRIKFTFRNFATDWASGVQDEAQTSFGRTFINSNLSGVVEIQIAIEVLQPLLRLDLTDAERLTNQFRVAQTLLHEFGHAVWFCIRKDRAPSTMVTLEPYFDAETISELGFSFVDKIWAGEAHAIQDPWYARYGPGLPIMGIYRTQWLEGQHGEKVQNVYDPTQPAPAFTQENALKPPSVYDDIYPVPTSWVHSVFQKATWDVSVKRTGTQSHMGPLTMGMRLLQTEPGKRADYFSWISAVDKELELTYALSIDPQANKIPPADYQRLVDATRIYLKMGILAEKRGELRSDKAFTSWPRQFGTDQITAHPFDPLPDDEEIPTETYSSPRYDEIVNYLCRNRGPLELALDTMGTLPTSVFYRYIRDRGGIDVLPMELWQFLGVANRKGEYFIFDPYPGPGLVTRIEAGWPPGNVLANMTIPRPAFLATRLEKDRLMEIVRDRNVQDELYTNNVHMRTMRDMDVDAFGRFLEARKDKSWIGKYVPAEFYAIVTQCVRETWDFNDEFTLGPQGIIRFTYDVRPTLTRNGSDYQKAKFAELQQRVDEANRKWRNRV